MNTCANPLRTPEVAANFRISPVISIRSRPGVSIVRICGIGLGLIVLVASVKKIAFIDLEASGLGPASWPIEVGWCFPDNEPEALLIAPSEEWSDEAWDNQAEALHGVSQKTLRKNGQPVNQVCQRLNKALTGVDVFSDAPDWDGFWLYRLFSAAGVKQGFGLKDFGELLGEFAPEKISAAVSSASETAPHSHRAREDVLHMKAVYQLVVDR